MIERNELTRRNEPEEDKNEMFHKSNLDIPEGFLPKIKWLIDYPINII